MVAPPSTISLPSARPASTQPDPAFPLILKTPDVCGGAACAGPTRIAVWMIEGMRQLGATEADMLVDWPSLRRDELAQALGYAAAHRDEIEAAIRLNDSDDDDDDDDE